MRRLVLLFFAVVVAGGAIMASGAERASASVTPPPYLDGTYAEDEAALLDNLVEFLVPAYEEAGGVMLPGHALPETWEYLLADVAEAGGTELMPASLALGPVGLAVAGTLTIGGTLIYMHWFHDDSESSGFSSASCKAQNVDDMSTCRISGQRWTKKASAAVGGATAFEWEAQHLSGPYGSIVYDPAGCNSYLLSSFGYPCNLESAYGRDFTREMDWAVGTVTTGSLFSLPAQNDVGGCSTCDGIAARVRYKTAVPEGIGQIMNGLHLDYLGTDPVPGTYTNTATHTMPTPTHDSTDAVPIIGDVLPIQPDPPGNEINCRLDPTNWLCPDPITGDPPGGPVDPPDDPDFEPFALPQIALDETYGAYVARLRALGWLGTVVLLHESALELSADPESAYATAPINHPTTITVPGESPYPAVVPLYFPGGEPQLFDGPSPTGDPSDEGEPWPDPAPVIHNPDEPIQIRIKPPDSIFPVLPPPGDSGGCHCDIAAVSFPDVSSPCDKFPFGVFCWIGDQLDILFLGPAIPWHATVELSALSLPGGVGSLPDFTWDFADVDWFDGYFAIIRNVLGFFLWLWGLWVYGKRKFGGAGLPDGGEGELENVGD